jgi:hypothetical protein
MRIRTVKPQFFTHEELSGLPADTHLLAAGLLCYADDDGYFLAHPDLVKAAIFPLRDCSVSAHDMLNELAAIGFVRLGTGADRKRYGQVVKFSEHQRVNRALASKIRTMQIVWDNSPTPHGGLIESSLPEVEVEVEVEKEKEVIKEIEGEALPPSPRLSDDDVFPPTEVWLAGIRLDRALSCRNEKRRGAVA